jgi:membrane glycosyltransferase
MGWISVTGLVLGGIFWFTPDLFTSTVPILLGLVLAVPLTMLGANKVAGLKLKTNGLFMTPEERRPPAIVRAALGSACEPPIRWFARNGRPIGPTTKIRDAA